MLRLAKITAQALIALFSKENFAQYTLRTGAHIRGVWGGGGVCGGGGGGVPPPQIYNFV